jgi:hypothetical protein
MRHWHVSVLGFVVAALLLGPGGCKKPDTILLIEVAGPTSLNASQFRVTVTAGLDARAFLVPPMPRVAGDPIGLPTSFSLGLDRSRTGPITVSIDALDVDQSPLGFGTTMQEHIVIGGQTVITVFLMEGAPPDTGPDGGAGGTGGSTTGAGGQGGSGGQSGSAGQGGSGGQAGQDGSAGRDAEDDAMGLDGAAD